ncbi:hypothetical protein MKW98_018705, partial [Papaver atlanticum]
MIERKLANPDDYNAPENPTTARRFRLNRLLTKPFYVQLRSIRLHCETPNLVDYNIPENPRDARRFRLARLLTKPFYVQLRSIRIQYNNEATHTDILNPEPANLQDYNAPENPTTARRFRLARLLNKPFYSHMRFIRLQHINQTAHTDILNGEQENSKVARRFRLAWLVSKSFYKQFRSQSYTLGPVVPKKKTTSKTLVQRCRTHEKKLLRRLRSKNKRT